MVVSYSTPEETAVTGFDPRYARVVRTIYRGSDEAEVELATNEEPYLYHYWVRCHRGDEGWVEIASGNAPTLSG